MLQRTVGAVLAAITLGLGVVLVGGAATFDGTFTGAPTSPRPYIAPDLDVTYSLVGHTDPPQQWTDAFADSPQHGAGCEPPGHDGSVRHATTTVRDTFFQCANHVMTYGPSGTSAVRLNPNQLLDLSSGEARFRFAVSTLVLSDRDWIEIAIQNWDVQEQKITDSDTPSAQGNPRDAIIFQQGASCSFNSAQGKWNIRGYDSNRNRTCRTPDAFPGIYDLITPSAQTRTLFEITVAKTGYAKIAFLAPSGQWVTLNEAAIAPFTWDVGVLTLLHNTYSPDKGTNPTKPGCCGNGAEANTWHWDDFTFPTPVFPFEIIKTDVRSGETFTFARPLPANALVRFAAWGDNLRVSFDGGAFVPATRQSAYVRAEHAASYTVAGLEGATRITIAADGPYIGFDSVSAWVPGGVPSTPAPTASSSPTPSPTSPASPTPTPTATATTAPTATATVAPTPVPTPTAPAVNARCTVRDRNDANTSWAEREGTWVQLAPNLWTCAVSSVGRAP